MLWTQARRTTQARPWESAPLTSMGSPGQTLREVGRWALQGIQVGGVPTVSRVWPSGKACEALGSGVRGPCG